MVRLKYLTLIFSKQISISSCLCNGNQWKLFLSLALPKLKRFYLKLPLEEQTEFDIQNSLITFQSSWWFKEKEWFIEYIDEENALMTVPYFAKKIFDHSNLHFF